MSLVLQGVSVPALNGVISAWAPTSERGRLLTIAYAGNEICSLNLTITFFQDRTYEVLKNFIRNLLYIVSNYFSKIYEHVAFIQVLYATRISLL